MTETASRPLLVASNRLPISLKLNPDRDEASSTQWSIEESVGGLATALRGAWSDGGFRWVGWPGSDVPSSQRENVEQILRDRGLLSIFLTPRERARYYNGFCNGVLWPLFHYFTDRVRFDARAFASYHDVNARFAEVIAKEAPPSSRVWIQDFQLMLVPKLLRAKRPDLEISFFLHIPFPSSEIYRSLPAREEILLGLLGADYIGFHTSDYARHFRSCCLRILGFDSEPDGVMYQGRRVGIGNHPIGIPVSRFQQALESDAARAYTQELRSHYQGRRVLLGVERLDYTKGIPHKLDAFDEFLRRDPNRAREVVLVQLIVPSRLDNPDYRHLKRDIEEQIGRINGRYGMPGFTPIEYLHRNLDVERLAALYAFVDAMLVTPVRDGMNLVAQEFVLCQAVAHQRWGVPPGALLLSEFAGAAHSLSHSILVNPWDVKRTATAIEKAIALPARDRIARIEGMAEHVREMDCERWASEFLVAAESFVERRRESAPARALDEASKREILDAASRARRRQLFLDYDGTLRELTRLPSEAVPTEEILEILRDLANLPQTEVHVVSGRDRSDMESWLGDLPVHLAAEHGYAAKAPGGTWSLLSGIELDWLPHAEAELRRVVKEVPGSLLECKPCSVAWHYRMADMHYGSWRARELSTALEDEFSNQPIEVLLGHKVVEVRAAGVNKGAYLKRFVDASDASSFVLAIGDDRTDLDMYAALPASAITIHLGIHAENIDYRLEGPESVRALLRAIIEAVGGQEASGA